MKPPSVVAASVPGAQDLSYRATVWTVGQGLPDRRVQAIHQSRDGYLWVGTYHGLARFDGLRFSVFDTVNVPAMASDNCTALAEDDAGVLWIGTTQGLLAMRDGRFRLFTPAEGLPEPEIRMLEPAAGGGVWVGNARGLNRVREDGVKTWTVREGLTHEWVYCVDQASDGTVWLGTQLGLQRLDPQTGKVGEELGGPAQTLRYGVRGIFAESHERAWIYWQLAHSQELRHYDRGLWRTNQLPGPVELAGHMAWLVRDRNGAFWMSAGRHGLDRFLDGRFNRFRSQDGLPDDWVLASSEDREGNLWIGTDAGGLTRWRREGVRTLTRRNGLEDESCWAVCGGRDGGLWVATNDGLTRIDGEQARTYREADGLPRNTVRALLLDAAGDLWVGTGGGLCVMRGGQIEPRPLPGGLSENKIRALAQGPDGRIWVGTEAGLFHGLNGRWARLGPAEGLPHPDVRALLADRYGQLWAGTFGGGLFRLGPDGTTVFRTADGLTSDVVWALHEGRDGTLWAGTQAGLCWLAGGRWTALSTAEGLLELAVNSVLEDDRGEIWLGGEQGIYRLSRTELDAFAAGRLRRIAPAAYGAADGLRNVETNGQKSQPAAWRDVADRLWFATAGGVGMIVPDELRSGEVAPTIVIESAFAGEECLFRDGTVTPGHAGQAWRTGSPPVLRLSPRPGRALAVHYTAPSFVAPEMVRFRYRLNGVDDDWTEAGTRRTAYYTHLRPGDYTFQVTACNSHGRWSETAASLGLRIEPYLHETLGFRLALAGGLVAMLIAAVRWPLRTRLRLERLERDHALAQERSRIAKDLHDEMGAGLTAVASHLELARRSALPAAVSAQLERAQDVLAESARTMSEIVWSTDSRQDTVEATVAYLCRYTEEFLEPTGLRCRFELPPAFPTRTLGAAVRHEVLLTAKEALNNAVKHAAATEVHLGVVVDDRRLRLTIDDNGRGLPSGEPPDRGNGLPNMRRRITSVAGRLVIEPRPGGGTRVLIEVPLLAVDRAAGT